MKSSIIPTHIAIICDGNRRWAKDRGLPVFAGHERAVNHVFESLIDHAQQRGIKFITFWIFSTENWQRDKKEVEMLMNLFRGFFDKQIKKFNKKNIRFKMIGRLADFAPDIQERIKKGEADTQDNTGITATLGMSYGGRDEIVRAVKKWASEVITAKKPVQVINKLTEPDLSRYLDTSYMPDPDLIVRTSGEHRLSGFMMWQLQYSEFYFPQWHFAEFTPKKLDECMAEFQNRQRWFGK